MCVLWYWKLKSTIKCKDIIIWNTEDNQLGTGLNNLNRWAVSWMKRHFLLILTELTQFTSFFSTAQIIASWQKRNLFPWTTVPKISKVACKHWNWAIGHIRKNFLWSCSDVLKMILVSWTMYISVMCQTFHLPHKQIQLHKLSFWKITCGPWI